MNRTIDPSKAFERQTALPTVEEVRRMMAPARDTTAAIQRPIDIQINLGNADNRARRRDEAGFSLFRSKLFWVVVVLSLSMSVAYARTRYVCQSFKDNGRFFYGMGVDRCIGVLIKQPFERVDVQFELINRSY